MFFSSLLFSITHPSITLYGIDTFRVPRTTQDAWPLKSKGTDACTTMSFEGAGAREVDRPVSVSATSSVRTSCHTRSVRPKQTASLLSRQIACVRRGLGWK
jgi:hypothetical protein